MSIRETKMKCIRVARLLALLTALSLTAINGDIVTNGTQGLEDSVQVSEYKNPVLNFLYPPGLTVQEIVQREFSEWHWYPWKHVRVAFNENSEEEEEEECEVISSIEDLPDDLFTRTNPPVNFPDSPVPAVF